MLSFKKFKEYFKQIYDFNPIGSPAHESLRQIEEFVHYLQWENLRLHSMEVRLLDALSDCKAEAERDQLKKILGGDSTMTNHFRSSN